MTSSEERGGGSEVFVSYARRDAEFVRRLHDALAERERKIWVDWRDIRPTAKWMDEVRAAIEGAEAFAFVISPDSVDSEICREEIQHAAKLNKRILPIVYREVDDGKVPEPATVRNWIFFRDQDDFGSSMETLLRALDTDPEWARVHTRLLVRAIEWDANARDPSFVLRGRDLETAERWLIEADERKDPQPTRLHTEYIIASRQAATRGQRIRMAVLGIGILIAVGLATFAFIQRHRAREQEQASHSRELAATALLEQQTNPALGLLLAVEAGNVDYTTEAGQALRAAIERSRVLAVLRGHVGPVNDASYSRDGSLIVTASDDGSVRAWDASTGEQLDSLDPGGGKALSAAFSPDTTKLVASTSQGSVQVWRTDSWEKLLALSGHVGRVWSAEFSPDGKRIVTAGGDGKARVWDAATGRRVTTFKGHSAAVYSAAFSPNGARIVTASADGTARVWDSDGGPRERVFSIRDQEGVSSGTEVNAAGFSPDGGAIITASSDGTGRVWDLRTGRVEFELPAAKDEMYTAAFSQDGERVVTGSLDAGRVWDVSKQVTSADPDTGPPRARLLSVLRVGVNSAAFSPDGERVITASADGTARVWDATDDDALFSYDSHQDFAVDAAFSPDGRRVATAVGNTNSPASVRIWDVRSRRTRVVLSPKALGQTAYVWDVDYSPGGGRVVTADNGDVRIFDASTGRRLRTLSGQLRTLSGYPARVYQAEFSQDGERVVTAGADGTIRVWNTSTGREVAKIPGQGYVLSAVFSPDGSRVAGAGKGGTVRVWDPATRDELLPPLEGHSDDVNSIAFSSDGTRIVTGSEDGTARIWDASSGASLAVLRGHNGAVLDAEFSPDGTEVATGGVDRTVRVWDARSGQLLDILHGHSELVHSVAYSPDGRIVSASDDGTSRVFQCELCVPFDQLVAMGERRLTRTLSPQEKAQYLHD